MSTDGLMLSAFLAVLESVPTSDGGLRKAALSTDAVDVLFDRMSGVYMNAWVRALGETPLADAKSAWAHELGGFSGNRDKMLSIAWALKNLPDYPPSAVQFRRLCEQAPRPKKQDDAKPVRLPTPAESEMLRASLRVVAVAFTQPAPAGDCDIVNGGLRSLSWARRVIKRAVDFELCNTSSPPSSYAQKLAVSALGAQSVHDAAAMLGFMRAEGMQHDNAS